MLLKFDFPAKSTGLVSDYARPDALCVPFWKFSIERTLKQIARRAARHVGVILLGPDERFAREFLASETLAERMAFLPGVFDSPWLRDHAPISVREPDRMMLYRPKRPKSGRDQDAELFAKILNVPSKMTPIKVAGGNLVAGGRGIAVSTYDLIDENKTNDASILTPVAQAFGISRWILTPAFDDDISRHTDNMVRFLGPDLCAICTRPDRPDLANQIDELRADIQRAAPAVRILQIPAGTRSGAFCSALNWIQLGRTFLVPHFPNDLDPGRNVAAYLRAEGFKVVLINCPTNNLGGALHCLTASVFAK